MTSKACTTARRTFYLDQATLSYAFKASYGTKKSKHAMAEVEALTALVETIAKEHNLCISLLHVQELAQFRGSEGEGMAEWLETLPLVWTRSVQHYLLDEAAAALEHVLGLSTRNASPWASCLSATLETATPVIMTGRFLHLASVPLATAALAARPKDRTGDYAMQWAKRIFEDNRWANQHGWTKAEKKAWHRKQHDNGVRAVALQAAQHLGLPYRSTEVRNAIEEMVRQYAADPWRALPGRAMQGACIEDWLTKARARELGDAHRSTLYDIQHATMGAAFADVFTCDSRTAPAIQKPRRTLDKAAPLVSRPDAVFVTSLRALIA